MIYLAPPPIDNFRVRVSHIPSEPLVIFLQSKRITAPHPFNCKGFLLRELPPTYLFSVTSSSLHSASQDET